MAKKIPSKIKKEVIDDWLSGLSRDKIATKNKISQGSVSKIINAVESQEIPDIDLLRAVAIELKRNGLTLVTLSRSIRLRKMLDNMRLSEEKVEKLLEYLPILFYRNDDTDIEEFLKQLELVHDIAIDLRIPVSEMPLEIDRMKKELDDLKNDEAELQKLVERTWSNYQKIRQALDDIGRRRIPPLQ